MPNLARGIEQRGNTVQTFGNNDAKPDRDLLNMRASLERAAVLTGNRRNQPNSEFCPVRLN